MDQFFYLVCRGVFFLVFSLVLFPAESPGNMGHPIPLQSKERIPSLIRSIQFNQPIQFCGKPVPLENFEVRQRLEKEMLLTLWNRPQVILWIKRGARYFPIIERILLQEGLSPDLKYVPLIESALRPHARSSAGATGFWQFIKSTGRKYNLKINRQVDERRNLIKSTRAACAYIKKLKGMFLSYPLALSAYNMGENRLTTEIEAQGTRDYFSLYLPLETQRYVFKLIAAKLILEQPNRYGFKLQPSDLYPVFQFSKIEFKSDIETPLLLVAKAAGVSFKIIKDMNPEIRGYDLPPGKNHLLVPPGKEKGFKEKFIKLHQTWAKESHSRIHVVRKGESLLGIAGRYNISLSALLRQNNLSMKNMIHPGDRLKVRP